MEKHILWASLRWSGLEHLHLHTVKDTIQIDSLLIAELAGKPARFAYQLTCDPQWRARNFKAEFLGEKRQLELYSDGRGRWMDAKGKDLNELNGCFDLDLSITPFTNTLPIRRLGFTVGETHVIKVAYIKVPELEFRPAAQRYTCLALDQDGAIYRYESGTFTADLQVDGDGLVVDYPGIWQRLF